VFPSSQVSVSSIFALPHAGCVGAGTVTEGAASGDDVVEGVGSLEPCSAMRNAG